MRLLKLSFFVMFMAVLFMACQKEYSVENSNLSGPAGTWQFIDSTRQFSGNMDSAYIETTGSTKILHLEGTSLTGGQLFAMRIYGDSILKTGTYRASLGDVDFSYFTTAGGIYHADQLAGEFIVNITVLANNTVTGTFSGLADDSLLNTKTLTLGQFTSRVDLSTNVIGGGGGGSTATGTLGNTAGNCLPSLNNGTYTQGVALNSSNTVEVQVSVATPGAYTISTNTVNGVSFTKSGTFTSTGTQNVILNGTGTPATAGAQNFTVTFGTSTCSFVITFLPAAPPAVGTLGGGPGVCTPVTPAGTYAQGVALTASNTITIQANVTTIGSYNITTNTVNGVTFAKSGNFTTTGPQNVVLNGTGTPTASGVQNFAVTFGTSTCNFPVTFTAAPPPASGTLGGGPGSCTPVTPAGTYSQGVALTSSNTITIQANVFSIGAYNITTNTVNGVTFSGSGNFTATGPQNVVLTGSGTSTASGAQNFAVTFGMATCNFAITFAAGAVGVYSCTIDGVPTTFTDRAHAEIDNSGVPYLYLDGHTGPANGNTVPEFQIFIEKNDNSAVTTGTYNGNSFLVANGYRIEIDYTVVNPDQSVTIWNTASTLFPPPNPPFTIIVTSASATRVKGTFSGTLTNTLQGSTAFKIITQGVFDLPVQ